MTQSLFSAVTRFIPGDRRDPFEERLTEALAGTLRAAPEAACELELVRRLDPTTMTAGELTVTPQRWTRDGDRVDVELCFGPVAQPKALVWLELKVDAPPDASQMRRYDDALRERARPAGCAYALALVTKRDVPEPLGMPADVKHCT